MRGQEGRACPLRGGFCALRVRVLSFSLIWAASGGGRWGPVRGCRPSEAPSALPPDDPAGLVAYLHSHGLALRGFPYAVIPRGLRGFCSGSFLATLGDLPARRAMPACTSALNARPREHLIGCRKLQKWRALATDKLINRKIWTWACSLRDIFSALRARRLFFFCCLGRLRREGEIFAAKLQEKAKPGLSFERRLLCPAGTGAFLYFNLGRLRGGRQMGAC